MGATKSKKPAKPVIIGVNGVPEELKRALREAARRNNRSLSGQIRAILEASVTTEAAQ